MKYDCISQVKISKNVFIDMKYLKPYPKIPWYVESIYVYSNMCKSSVSYFMYGGYDINDLIIIKLHWTYSMHHGKLGSHSLPTMLILLWVQTNDLHDSPTFSVVLVDLRNKMYLDTCENSSLATEPNSHCFNLIGTHAGKYSTSES